MQIRCAAISLSLLMSPCYAQDGSVEGDFNSNTGNSNSNIESGNKSNSTNNTYNGAGSSPGSQPPPTASAPTVMGAGGTDSCLMPRTSGIQVSLFGFAQGTMVQDPECNRRKDARLMGQPQPHGLGLQIAGLSILCNGSGEGAANVFKSMALSSTPCPIYSVTESRILTGRDAYEAMRNNPAIYVVGYEKDKDFWDTFLRMDLGELPDVKKTRGGNISLSERFRSTRTANNGSTGTSGRSNDNPPASGTSSDNELRSD